MYKWFKSCKTAEDGKSLYRDLLKKFHPDNGATDDSIIKEINSEFSDWWKQYKNIHQSDETGKTYYKENTEQDISQFMDILSRVIHLSGIEIEICGSWVWVTGNTYPVHDALNEAGFRWSRSKKAWYWAYDLSNVKYRSRKTLNQIRFKYGSQKVGTNPRPELD